MMANQKSYARLFIEGSIFLVLFISYFYILPRWADPNQNSRLDMVIAVVDDGTFQIDNYYHNTVDYAKVGDHYFSDKAPGAAFVGIPVYAITRTIFKLPLINRLFEQLSQNAAFQSTLNPEGTGILIQKVRFAITQVVLTIVVSAIPTALAGVLMFRILKKFEADPLRRLFVVLTYGLLTPVFAYAGAFYGHQLSSVLLFTVFYIILEKEILSAWHLMLIGFLLAFSVITEYPAALIAGVLFVYLSYKLLGQKKFIMIGWVILSGGIVAIGWMFYNIKIFGGPFSLGYSNSELWIAQHHTGFMSLTWPHWDALWGITFSAFRGLFFYSPILLLGIPGAYFWFTSKKYRAEWWVVMLSSITIFIFNSSSIMWWGGYGIGPRYLLPMLPFWMLFIPFTIQHFQVKIAFHYLRVLLVISSFVAIWGMTLAGQSYPKDTIQNPLLEIAFPSWISGNIARNLGTFLGIPGVLSLMPLFILLLLILVWQIKYFRKQIAV